MIALHMSLSAYPRATSPPAAADWTKALFARNIRPTADPTMNSSAESPGGRLCTTVHMQSVIPLAKRGPMFRIEIEPVWRFRREADAQSLQLMLDFLNEIRATGKMTR